MNLSQEQHNSTLADRLTRAMGANQLDEADDMLTSCADELPAQALLPAALLHMRRQRFAQAAALFDRAGNLDIHGRLQRNAARNYASLQQHRPADYQRLIRATLSRRYQLAPVTGNRLTIADCKNPAKPMLLTPGQDPVAAVQQALSQLESRMKDGSAVGLIGIGDGFLLGTLARVTPKLFMDMQICVHLLEPDLSLINTCFQLHDYSGPHGPIEQSRFLWHIGDDWRQRYLATLRHHLMLPAPGVIVQQSLDRHTIAPVIAEHTQSLSQADEQRRIAIEHHYASINTAQLVRTIRGDLANRPPRVLLLTSRFTTVLQYATQGIADGFRAGGWEAKVLIEPTPHHQISPVSMRQALADFKPDLVFQIDHQRYEHEGVFPENLPFVCWIQDHLPHLTDVKAGREVGRRDFVLTFASPMFVDTYHYPARQCIDMPMMLTTPRTQLPERDADAPDLVYVSNVSHDPRSLESKLLQRAQEPHRELVGKAIARIIARYDAGCSLASHHEVRLLLDEVASQSNMPLPDAEALRQIVEQLWNPLNIALYRQQALAWVAQAADALNLKLGLYGRGWDAHPQFSQYAKGTVEHGEALAKLTRSASINLNLEPYVCFTHQRLLDGLVAGGFFLVRSHPGNTLMQELLNLLVEEFDEAVQTADQARAAASRQTLPRLEDLLAKAACLTFEDNADPVRQVRCWQRAGVLVHQDVALPHLADVSFEDAAGCRSLIERFIHAKDECESISQAQRQGIEKRLSFEAGMKMVVRRITQLIENESKLSPQAVTEAA